MVISRRDAPASIKLIQQVAPLLVYAALAAGLLWVDRHQIYSSLVHNTLRTVAEPVYRLVEWPLQVGQRGLIWLQDQSRLSAELETARALNAALRADMQLRDGLAAENQLLRQQLGLPGVAQWTVQSAAVSALAAPRQGHFIRIRFDPAQPLSRGQPVIDGDGVLGQVEHVRTRSADVTLITDPDHALPVRIERTGELTLAHGGGQRGDLHLRELPMNIDLQPGDRLLTSGLDEVFPAGLPVALISTVERSQGQAFAEARAALLAQPQRAHFVSVLAPQAPLLEPVSEQGLDLEQELEQELGSEPSP